MWIYISKEDKEEYENLYLKDYLEMVCKSKLPEMPSKCPTCGRPTIDYRIVNPYPT